MLLKILQDSWYLPLEERDTKRRPAKNEWIIFEMELVATEKTFTNLVSRCEVILSHWQKATKPVEPP